jgi:hypothetical protein
MAIGTEWGKDAGEDDGGPKINPRISKMNNIMK